MQQVTTRENWIDIAKAISIFMIVYGHCLDEDTASPLLMDMMTWGWTFEVPVFYIISGYLFRIKEDNFPSFFNNSFRSLIIPYIFFNVISGIIFLKLQSHETWIGGLHGFLLAKSTSFAGPAWFLVALFWVRVLMFFICKIKREGFRALLSIAAGLLFFYMPINIDLGIRNAFVAVPFFYVGTVMKDYSIMSRYSEVNYRLKFLVVVALVLSVWFFKNYTSLLGFGYAHGFNEDYPLIRYFEAIVACFMVFVVSELCNKYQFKLITAISKGTIVIMGMHITILQIIWAYRGKLPEVLQIICYSPYFIVTIFLMSLLLSWFLRKYCPILVGNRK